MVIYMSIAAAIGAVWTTLHHLLTRPVTEVDRKLSAVDHEVSRDEEMRSPLHV
jgi:hypothetical protein